MSTVKISEYTGTGSFGYVSSSGKLFAGIAQDSDQSGTNVVVYNPTTGEFEYTGSYIGSDSVLATASHAITASYLNQPLTEFSSSNISIDGFPDLSASLAGVTTPSTASYAVSASHVVTASYAVNAGTSTFSISATNASNAANVYLTEVNNDFGYGLLFRGSSGDGYQAIKADSGEYSPTYNPSTNTLSSAYISASSDLYVSGTLSIDGYPDVSASLANLSATNVNISGTPSNNQITIFTDASTIEGDSNFTWTGTEFRVGSSGNTFKVVNGNSVVINNGGTDVTFQVEGSSDNNLLQVNPQSDDKIGIGTSTPSEKLTVQGNISASGNIISSHITASGNISASGTITGNDIIANSTLTMDGNLTINNGNQLVNSDDKAVISINANDFSLGESGYPLTIATNLTSSGNISSSGVLSIPGFPDVSASLAAAAAGGFTPSLSTDITARNITASGDISASGDLYGEKLYSYGKQLTSYINGAIASPAINEPLFGIGASGAGSIWASSSLAQQFHIVTASALGHHMRVLHYESNGIVLGGENYFHHDVRLRASTASIYGHNGVEITAITADMTIQSTTSGDITISAADNLNITGDTVDITGNITASGAISASGVLSIPGFPDVSASLAAGFTPSLSTDLEARNITASGDISASGDVYGENLWAYGEQFTGYLNAAALAVSEPAWSIGNAGKGSLWMSQSLAQQFHLITGSSPFHMKVLWYDNSTKGIVLSGDPYFDHNVTLRASTASIYGHNGVDIQAITADMTIKTHTSGDLTILAADNLSITGDTVDITGHITASGNISASGDISAYGSSSFHGLPTTEPSVTGALWISGSSEAHPNSGYLMVFNP